MKSKAAKPGKGRAVARAHPAHAPIMRKAHAHDKPGKALRRQAKTRLRRSLREGDLPRV